MVRAIHKLNALQVAKLAKPGRHGDGGGLYLSISDGGRRRWVFVFRDRRTGKLREMGLGSASDVTLAKAREKAAAARSTLQNGEDPFIALRSRRAPAPTFGEIATEFMASMEGQWRNEKHRRQWRMTLEQYAKPLWPKPVNEIGVEDVLVVLKPHWERRPETAGRLRGRIERILNSAKAQGYRTGENPAAWRGHLENVLPARSKLSRGHHKALPWRELPEFMAALRGREGVAALALEFAILTAARSSEVRGMVWSEVNLERKVWTIPPGRMKGAREHRVPLVDRAVEILASLEPLATARSKGSGKLVFPGRRPTSAQSDMTLAAVLKRMEIDATVHGFRSSFKDWATEVTAYPNELSEAALAHVTGDKTERAYRRGDALERRREMMEAWAKFCEPSASGNVVQLRSSQ